MSHPAKSLAPGEEVVLDAHPHWWFLIRPVTLTLALVALALAAALVNAPEAVDWLVGGLLVIAVVWLLVRYLRWLTTSLVLTSARLVLRHGVIGRTNREIPLSHLNDVTSRQSFGRRLIGCGDLLFESAGHQGQERFADASHPERIQQEVYRQMERAQTPAPYQASLSIPEQIDQLDQLRRRGILTGEEFDAKKSELLRRM